MELSRSDEWLIKEVLHLGDVEGFSFKIIDGKKIAAYNTGDKIIAGNLYNITHDFYYPDYRDLADFQKNVIDLAITIIRRMGRGELTEYRTSFSKYTDQLAQTLHDKNSDYGDSFSKGMKRYGATYVTSRLFYKLNRIDELSSKDEQLVKDESLIDTVKDLAGYAILLWKYLEERGAK